MSNAPDYKRSDPRGWCGDPSRGAALGRPTIHDAPTDEPIKLYVLPIRLIDGGCYDVNGTYFGSGDPLFWIADENGLVDYVTRAKDRDAACKIALDDYPRAMFAEDRHYAGEAPEIDPFVIAYATCALWSSCDEDGAPLDDGRDVDDLAPATLAGMIADCKAFREQAGALLDGIDEEQAGHDFWLTRNGHGAGFWDRGLGDRGDKLTKLCKPYGSVDLYVGDDGKIHGHE